MDALLLSLILCFMVEMRGGMARRFGALAAQSGARRMGRLWCVLFIACVANACVAALAGAWIAPMLTPEARRLFLAFALAIAGAAMLFAWRRAADGGKQGSGSLIRAGAGLFMDGLGGSAPLLITALAIFFADPWMAGMGGALGCCAGCLMAREAGDHLAVRALATGLGGAQLVAAFVLAMGALRLL